MEHGNIGNIYARKNFAISFLLRLMDLKASLHNTDFPFCIQGLNDALATAIENEIQ